MPRISKVIRRAVVAIATAALVGSGLILTAGAASAAPGVVPPDWGVTCALAKPPKNAAFTYKVAFPASKVLPSGKPVCRYIQNSAGSAKAGVPAFWVTIERPISWDQACRLSYGPKSRASGQKCSLPDGGSYYVNVATPKAIAASR